jgi:hypothetical protein
MIRFVVDPKIKMLIQNSSNSNMKWIKRRVFKAAQENQAIMVKSGDDHIEDEILEEASRRVSEENWQVMDFYETEEEMNAARNNRVNIQKPRGEE